MKKQPQIAESKIILVFDIGGTNIRAGVYNVEEKKLYSIIKDKTDNFLENQDKQFEELSHILFYKIYELGSSILKGRVPSAVSVAFAGPIDNLGNAESCATIFGKKFNEPISFHKKISEYWPSSKIFISNDITAAGYAYVNDFRKNFCIITISSGIGSKIFINGKPILGSTGKGGEIGHYRVNYDVDAPVCDCGEHGHLSAVASGRASSYHIKKLCADKYEIFNTSILKNISEIKNEDIVSAFKDGDIFANLLVQEAASYLGKVIGFIYMLLEIKEFIIVGGFSIALGENYLQLLMKYAKESTWKLSNQWDHSIYFGDKGDDSCLFGAGYLASIDTI